VTVSTQGMPSGKYNITSSSAFWMVKSKNQSTGIPFKKSIPFTLGDPAATTKRNPPNDDAKIHWGRPAGNLVLGMKLLDDRDLWPNDDVDIEGQLFLFNAGDEPLDLICELPSTASDWNMHLTADDKHVRLDWTWFTGMEPTRIMEIKLEPGESVPVTSIRAPVSTGGKDPVEEQIKGPLVRVLTEKTEFKYGDPKRLIGHTGKFEFHAAMTIRKKELKDSVIIASSAPVPFVVTDAK